MIDWKVSVVDYDRLSDRFGEFFYKKKKKKEKRKKKKKKNNWRQKMMKKGSKLFRGNVSFSVVRKYASR